MPRAMVHTGSRVAFFNDVSILAARVDFYILAARVEVLVLTTMGNEKMPHEAVSGAVILPVILGTVQLYRYSTRVYDR